MSIHRQLFELHERAEALTNEYSRIEQDAANIGIHTGQYGYQAFSSLFKASHGLKMEAYSVKRQEEQLLENFHKETA